MAVGLLLHWAALPPLGWWGAGWLVMSAWSTAVFLLGQRRLPWKRVWLLATIYWMAVLYFIPYPHPALWVGWPLMAAYCGLYPLAFFACSRRLMIARPLWGWWTLPATWVALEWIRNWMLTGFGMAQLGHAMFQQPWILPLAAWGGDYLITFAMTAFGFLVAIRWNTPAAGRRFACLGCSSLIILAALGAIFSPPGVPPRRDATAAPSKGVPVALVQGSIDTEFPELSDDPEGKAREIQGRLFNEYRSLTMEARKRWPDLEAVVWPETIFPGILVLDPVNSPELDAEQRDLIDQTVEHRRHQWQVMTGQLLLRDEVGVRQSAPIAMITGIPSIRLKPEQQFNSAVLIDDSGSIRGLYHKQHRVIFGEYFPLLRSIPGLSNMLQGMSELTPGTTAEVLELKGLRLMPAICFETTVPHLIRRQWLELTNRGDQPDGLVCLTNDGWFYGSSCLDFHLACNVFRAVETGTPMVVAANTGFSAWIDGRGKILERGPRRSTGLVRAILEPRTGGLTPCLWLGDWPWRVLVILLLGMLLVGRRDVRSTAERT